MQKQGYGAVSGCEYFATFYYRFCQLPVTRLRLGLRGGLRGSSEVPFLGGVWVTRLRLGVVCGVSVRFGGCRRLLRSSLAVFASFVWDLAHACAILRSSSLPNRPFPLRHADGCGVL